MPCVECVAIKAALGTDDDPSAACFCCEACPGGRGEDRMLCEVHVQSHSKKSHPSVKTLPNAAGLTGDPARSNCASHPLNALDRLCLTCWVTVCAGCCLKDGGHPEGSHDVQPLDAAAALLLSKLRDVTPKLHTGAAELAAASDAVVRAKADMLAGLRLCGRVRSCCRGSGRPHTRC